MTTLSGSTPDPTPRDRSVAPLRPRTQGGTARSDLLQSAHIGGNADLFPKILDLHVADGALIADVTWGKGVFWQRVDTTRYSVLASDLETGTDATDLPYDRGTLDALVFDPPYMEGLFRTARSQMAGAGSHAAFRENYSNGVAAAVGAPKYHAAVLDIYERGGEEAARVLKPGGVYIVKCMDEVSANRQELTHVQVINHLATLDFYCKDLFVLVRASRAGVSRVKRQVHARKNHSYFMVFVKACRAGTAGTMRSRVAA